MVIGPTPSSRFVPRLFGPEIFELAGKRDIGLIGSFKNQAVAEIQSEDARFFPTKRRDK